MFTRWSASYGNPILPPDVTKEIEQALCTYIHDQQFLSSGTSGAPVEIYLLTLSNRHQLVAKYCTKLNTDCMETEGYMLRYLAEHSDLPVPPVSYASPQLLVMYGVAIS